MNILNKFFWGVFLCWGIATQAFSATRSLRIADTLSSVDVQSPQGILSDTVVNASGVSALGEDSIVVDSLSLEELGEIFLADTLQTDSVVLLKEGIAGDSVVSKLADSLLIAREDTLLGKSMAGDKLQSRRKNVYVPHPWVGKFSQFVRTFDKEYQALLDRWEDIYLPAAPNRIQLDADFYKLIIPVTYYSAPIEEAFSIAGWTPIIPFVKDSSLSRFLPKLSSLTKAVDIDRSINRQLLSFYLDFPNLVRKNERDLKGLEPLGDEYKIKKPRKENVFHLSTSSEMLQRLEEEDLLVLKPNFWKMSGNGYVQFTQNFISDNWYKGGESTKSLLSGLVWQLNYNDQQKIQFENKVEWKLGFIATPSDTVHQYKPNNDLFRVSSKLGYKAFWSWYYTLSAEFKTQFASSYETNSEKLVSTFLSPAELNVGLGMDYKYVREGICNLSVLINPFNYTRYSVSSDEVDPTKFNIEAGKKVENQWGSRLEATLSWTIFKDFLWESRFSYTTNYEKVLSEWENTFTFAFNRYFSTKLFVHTRFDDSVTREPGDSYFQLQELLSLGFNYVW